MLPTFGQCYQMFNKHDNQILRSSSCWTLWNSSPTVGQHFDELFSRYSSFLWKNMIWLLTNYEYLYIGALQKCIRLADLENSCKTSIYLQNIGSDTTENEPQGLVTRASILPEELFLLDLLCRPRINSCVLKNPFSAESMKNPATVMKSEPLKPRRIMSARAFRALIWSPWAFLASIKFLGPIFKYTLCVGAIVLMPAGHNCAATPGKQLWYSLSSEHCWHFP